MDVGNGFDRIAMQHAGVIDERIDFTDRSDQRRDLSNARQIEIHALADDVGSEFACRATPRASPRRKIDVLSPIRFLVWHP